MEAEKSRMLVEIQTLQVTIQQKNRELLHQRDHQLATLRGERGTGVRQLSQQVAVLQEELATAHAQIRGYKNKADLLKKDLEGEKVKISEETHCRIVIQEECDTLRGQVSSNSTIYTHTCTCNIKFVRACSGTNGCVITTVRTSYWGQDGAITALIFVAHL